MANFPPRAGSGNQSKSQPGSGSPPGDAVQTGAAQTGGGTVTGLRTAGVRPCPSCSTLVNVHATVCPDCGEQIATREKSIRCRRCRHRASSNLVICPHCGRDLQPAASRWLTWGLPLLAVLLLSSIVFLRAGRGDPADWAQIQVERVMRLVEALGNRLQPDVTISMIPAGQDPNDPLVSQAVQASAALAAAPANREPPVVDVVATSAEGASAETAGSAAQPEAGNVLPVDAAAAITVAVDDDTSSAAAPAEPATATTAPPSPTAEATATAEPTAEPTATATATAAPTGTATAALSSTAPATQTQTEAVTAVVTATSSAATRVSTRTAAASTAALTRTTTVTPTLTPSQAGSLLGLATSTPVPAEPTASPTPVATATPTPLAVYEVRRGDTLFEIATEYDVTVEDLLAANGLTEEDVYTIQPGDELIIPAPTPEGTLPVGGITATPAPAPATYTVRPGDTMLAIALRNGVALEDLMAANGLTIANARTLQPGVELVIPGAEAVATVTPSAAATGAVTSTATPTIAPTPSATPAPESIVRVDAPRLRAPENGTAVSCSGSGTLNWLPVSSVRPDDLYLVHLGYVNSIAGDGKEEVIWIISQQRPVSATSWALDNNLCGLAPNTAGKQWRWFVEVAETTAGSLRPVSPASPVWGFTWQ